MSHIRSQIFLEQRESRLHHFLLATSEVKSQAEVSWRCVHISEVKFRAVAIFTPTM